MFACDFDRTLIGEDALLRPRTEAAMRAARARGIRVIVVTGRMYQSIARYRAAVEEDVVVCYQGAVVADARTGRFLRHEPIPLELAKEAVAAVETRGFPLNCYVDDELYVAHETPESDAYAGFQGLTVHAVGDLTAWLDRPPTKLVAVGDPRELDGLGDELRARFDTRLFIAKSLPYFLELASPEVSKGSGMQFAAEHLGFSAAQTVAFGDGENDIELLEWAGYAVAVERSHEQVLARADFVCPGPRDEGVAQVIEAFLERATS